MFQQNKFLNPISFCINITIIQRHYLHNKIHIASKNQLSFYFFRIECHSRSEKNVIYYYCKVEYTLNFDEIFFKEETL